MYLDRVLFVMVKSVSLNILSQTELSIWRLSCIHRQYGV